MKVKIICGAQSAYACITTTNTTLDVRLSHGKSARTSLHESAAELRTEAARKLQMAELIENAAKTL